MGQTRYDQLWREYARARDLYDAAPSELNRARLLRTYRAWVADWLPNHADELTGQLRQQIAELEAYVAWLTAEMKAQQAGAGSA